MRAPEKVHQLSGLRINGGAVGVTHLVDDVTDGRAYRLHRRRRVLETLLNLRRERYLGSEKKTGFSSTLDASAVPFPPRRARRRNPFLVGLGARVSDVS